MKIRTKTKQKSEYFKIYTTRGLTHFSYMYLSFFRDRDIFKALTGFQFTQLNESIFPKSFYQFIFSFLVENKFFTNNHQGTFQLIVSKSKNLTAFTCAIQSLGKSLFSDFKQSQESAFKNRIFCYSVEPEQTFSQPDNVSIFPFYRTTNVSHTLLHSNLP